MGTKALVVGLTTGRARFAETLAPYSVEPVEYWPPQTEPKELPTGIGALILLMDSGPTEAEQKAYRKACAKASVRYVSALSRPVPLERALALAGFFKPKPIEEGSEVSIRDLLKAPPELPPAPKPEETEMPAPTPPQPPAEKASWSFDDLMGHLKATLKLMRDNHHVEEVFWSKEHGLNVTRKQSIDTDLD